MTLKEVVGFEGLYFVSDDGVLFGSDMKKRKSAINAQTGYVQQMLRKDKKQYMRYMHRLVAEAFIPNPNRLREVNHKDGNKLNNAVSNLEWVSRSQNMKHSYETGLRPTTKIAAYTKSGEFVRAFQSEREAVDFCGVNYNAGISNCLRGITKTAHGYKWKYIDSWGEIANPVGVS
jgi:hypothetical protein